MRIYILSTSKFQVYSRLNKLAIHDYNYIVGPHHINNNHWIAVIVDLKSNTFQVIDSKLKSNNLGSMCFQSWIDYNNKREDKCVKDWNHNIANNQHPIQSLADNHNRGVYVCKIIEQYVTNQTHS
jgi:hypothetical protein